MVSRFISKRFNKNSNAQTPARLNKGQAMVRGRDAALKDREVLRRKRLELKK